MSKIHTCVLRDAHAYTRSKSPWILHSNVSTYGRLMHYLSGGGMRTFGRTVRQEEARAKQLRFLAIAATIAAVWLIFYFI